MNVVVACELGNDGVFELVDAIHIRVACEPALDRFDTGVADVCGRVEVGLTGTESDDIFALGFEACGAGGDGECGRWLDALDASRNR